MDFVEAQKNIDSLNRFGSVLGLDNMYELLGRLGNPQEKLKVVHVAGTNGKGSTIAFLSSVLMQAGYKVAKYTSPVVFEYLEKYQINDMNISENDFAKIATKVLAAVDNIVKEQKGQPTIFEVETAMAYLYFYESGCDVAIIETGMGGDTDATNVCSQVLASVIVSVSLDHTGFLGNTLKDIAEHKSGIIKNGCPVIVYDQSAEVTDTVKEYADRVNAPVIMTSTDRLTGDDIFTYKTLQGEVYDNISISLKGVHQIKNACTVLEVVEQLKKQGYIISKEDVKKGMSNAVWHGRFEKISDEPLVIIDGAHNPGAVTMLRETLENNYGNTSFVFIMGVLADKDFTAEIKTMSGLAGKIITVTPENPRALPAAELAVSIRNIGGYGEIEVAESIEDAFVRALRAYECLEGQRAIVAFGSLSYLGQLKAHCRRILCR